jgi:hypothetical protein
VTSRWISIRALRNESNARFRVGFNYGADTGTCEDCESGRIFPTLDESIPHMLSDFLSLALRLAEKNHV